MSTVDLMEEIRLRLQAGIDANKIEVSHKNVYLAPREMPMKDVDYPMIAIFPRTGIVTQECFNNGAVEDFEIEISYAIQELQDDYNKLYDTSDANAGIVRNKDEIINYLTLNRSTGSPDLQMNNTAFDGIKLNWRIGLTEKDLLICIITLRVKTAMYTNGQL